MINKLVLCGASALLMLSGPAVAQKAAAPNDAQIAHIAYTAGQLDVDAGKQALAKSHNKAVRSFAETMVRDHGAVNEQALALVKKLQRHSAGQCDERGVDQAGQGKGSRARQTQRQRVRPRLHPE